jgi:hypothetical protein
MWIDERITKTMPGSIASASGHRRTAWLKRAARMAIWEIREKVMRETGEDIFNVIVTADRVEVTVRGEIDTTNRDAGDKKPYWAERRER